VTQPSPPIFEELGLGTSGPGLALRERLQAWLEGAWDHLLVLGESGTGRSLLLDFLAGVASERGQAVLRRQGHMWRFARSGGETLSRELWPIVVDLKSEAVSIVVDDADELDGKSQGQLLEALRPRRPGQSLYLLVAAHGSISRLVDAGVFSEGLWKLFGERHTLTLPSLREDPEQIPHLARRLVRQIARRFDLDPPPRLHSKTVALLQAAAWPGNVRQLRQVLERAVLSCENGELSVSDLPAWLLDGDDYGLMRAARASMSLEDLERCYIEIVLKMCNGHRSKAAAILDINRKTLATKIQRQNIQCGPSPAPRSHARFR
jgi:transcriptional regulator with AAA-type ATPase domain